MTEGTPPPSRADLLRQVVRGKVKRLQSAYLSDGGIQARAQSDLAVLRRADPTMVGADPTVWELTLSEIPDPLLGRGDEPSSAERAIHVCLILYALHQQSNQQPVHVPGTGLGAAVQVLARARGEGGEMDESTVKKLHQVALATGWEGRVQHLRSLVNLMRTESPPVTLDYGLLAIDLWRLGDPCQDSTYVLHSWGRGLHSRLINTPSTTLGESK